MGLDVVNSGWFERPTDQKKKKREKWLDGEIWRKGLYRKTENGATCLEIKKSIDKRCGWMDTNMNERWNYIRN
jgi:hypothetical protein